MGAWVARYLGPDEFGTLSIALAAVGIASLITRLGLESILVPKLTQSSDNQRHILANAISIQTRAGLIGYIILIAICSSLNSPSLQLVLLILGVQIIDHVCSTYRLLFESRLDLGHIVICGFLISLITAAFKVALILEQAPLWQFAILLTASQLIHSCATYVLSLPTLKSQPAPQHDSLLRRQLLREAWPLLFTGLVGFLYMNLDRLMLGWISGTEEVGVYSAANKIAIFAFFIPTALVKSLSPKLAQDISDGRSIPPSTLKSSTSILTLTGVTTAISLALLAPIITNLLYGPEFSGAGIMLAILAISLIPVSTGRLRNYVCILLSKQRTVLICNCLGLALNTALNLHLIPKWGGSGAAIATTASLAVAMWASGFLFPETRELATRQTQIALWSLTPKGMYQTIRFAWGRLAPEPNR